MKTKPRGTETVAHWREQALYQNQRKNTWKQRYYIALTCCLFLSLVTIGAALLLAFRPRAEPMPARPAAVGQVRKSKQHILASVYINGCSGTIISKGEKLAQGISCFHCFGAAGGTVYAYRADGKATKAKVEAIDPDHDLALFTVPANFALATAPIPERMLKSDEISEYSVVGYPGGVGPSCYPLSFENVPVDQRVKDDVGMWRWVFSVDGGKIQGGNSGCGLFVNQCLYGVVSHRNTANDGKTLRAAPHRDLLEFVRKNGRKDCGNGFCPVPRKDGSQPETPADPGDDSGGEKPAPDFKSDPNAPKWTPRPNVMLDAPYDGHGKPPVDLRGPHKKAEAIDKLRHEKLDARLTALEALSATSQAKLDQISAQLAGSAPGSGLGSLPGPVGATGAIGPAGAKGEAGTPGATGAKGDTGPAGKDVDPATLAAIQARLKDVETFQKNLAGSRLSGRVQPVSKQAAAVSP